MGVENIELVGIGEFVDVSANYGQITQGIFADAAYNYGMVLTTAEFDNNSVNNGTVLSAAFFHDQATNNGFLSSDAKFEDSSVNNGLISVSAAFLGTANNSGTVYGLATFTANAVNDTTGIVGQAEFTGTTTNAGSATIASFAGSSINNGFISLSSAFTDSSTNGSGSVISIAVFSGSSLNEGTILLSAIFNDNSSNELIGIIPIAFFNGNASNSGTILSAGTFNDNTSNSGTILSAAIFNDTASNESTGVVPTAIFNGSSSNSGTVLSAATFNDTASNESTGFVLQSTFADTSVNLGSTTSAIFTDLAANSGVATTASFLVSASNNGTVQQAVFTDFAVNEINGITQGTVIFSGSAVNTGTVAQAVFLGSASNTGVVTTSAIFADTAFNSGDVQGNAIFADTTSNTGTVSGDASFAVGASAGGSVAGNVDIYTPANGYYVNGYYFNGSKTAPPNYETIVHQVDSLWYKYDGNGSATPASGIYDDGTGSTYNFATGIKGTLVSLFVWYGDTSSAARTVTLNGTVTQSDEGGGVVAASFSNSRLRYASTTALETSDFTLEFFVKSDSNVPQNREAYFTTLGTVNNGGLEIFKNANGTISLASFYVSTDLTSTATITDTDWHHIAVVGVGGEVSLFIDGVKDSTVTKNYTGAGEYAIGMTDEFDSAFYGKIAGLRLIIGTALYAGSTYAIPTSLPTNVSGTELLLNFGATAVPSVGGGAGNWYDDELGHLVTLNGDITQVDEGDGIKAASSAGSGNLTINSSEDFAFGTGDYTIEMFVKFSTSSLYTNTYLYSCNATNTALVINTSNNYMSYDIVGVNSIIYGFTPQIYINTWHHIAVSRENGLMRAYLNGILILEGVDTLDYPASSFTVAPAIHGDRITNFRVIKGTALYTTPSFSIPTSLPSNISGTVLLLNFGSTIAPYSQEPASIFTKNGTFFGKYKYSTYELTELLTSNTIYNYSTSTLSSSALSAYNNEVAAAVNLSGPGDGVTGVAGVRYVDGTVAAPITLSVVNDLLTYSNGLLFDGIYEHTDSKYYYYVDGLRLADVLVQDAVPLYSDFNKYHLFIDGEDQGRANGLFRAPIHNNNYYTFSDGTLQSPYNGYAIL